MGGGLRCTHIDPAITRGELDGQLGAILVQFICQNFQALGVGFRAQEVAGGVGMLKPIGHGVGRGIDQAETAFCTLDQIGSLFRGNAAVSGMNGAHGGYGQSVFQGDRAKCDLFE